MVEVLYCLEYRFTCKTFAAIQRHVDAPAAYVSLQPDVVGYWDVLPEIPASTFPAVDGGTHDEGIHAGDFDDEPLDDAIRAADPSVIVTNSLAPARDLDSLVEYPLVHVRHGSSVGRGEVWKTVAELAGVVDVALAPGEYWASRYRERFDESVHTPVVGIPEADALVGRDPPRERRVLYAPTNHNYGGGSYLQTADHVLDVIEGSSYDLRFRPHPHDRTEEPGLSVTERSRDRIGGMANATFDEAEEPTDSMLAADLLVSDYSGIVTEWLHTGRPLVQLTALSADADVPPLGYRTDRLSVDLLDRLYDDGYPDDVARAGEERQAELGIPMDGNAGERAAREVVACTQ